MEYARHKCNPYKEFDLLPCPACGGPAYGPEAQGGGCTWYIGCCNSSGRLDDPTRCRAEVDVHTAYGWPEDYGGDSSNWTPEYEKAQDDALQEAVRIWNDPNREWKPFEPGPPATDEQKSAYLGIIDELLRGKEQLPKSPPPRSGKR